jgi:hypothetical protein
MQPAIKLFAIDGVSVSGGGQGLGRRESSRSFAETGAKEQNDLLFSSIKFVGMSSVPSSANGIANKA